MHEPSAFLVVSPVVQSKGLIMGSTKKTLSFKHTYRHVPDLDNIFIKIILNCSLKETSGTAYFTPFIKNYFQWTEQQQMHFMSDLLELISHLKVPSSTSKLQLFIQWFKIIK